MLTDTATDIDELAVYKRLRADGNSPIVSWYRDLQHRELRLALESGTARIRRFDDECRNGVYYLRAKLLQLLDGEWISVDGSYFETTFALELNGVVCDVDEAKRHCDQRMLSLFAWAFALSQQ